MATRTTAFRRLPFPPHDPDLRVSDAERAEVADRLGRHYADGRLDQDEFNARAERAMSAKTQSDLGGLFDDLPDLDVSPDVPARRERRRTGRRALLATLVIVVAVSVGHALWWFFMPSWLAVLLLVGVGLHLLRGGDRRRHHCPDPQRKP